MATETRRPTICVSVIDDHPMIRFGEAAMVQAERELQWLGDAARADNRTEAVLRPCSTGW